MLSSGCQPYNISIRKIPELREVDRRYCDRYWNNVENAIALSDRSSKSGKSFHTDTLRTVYSLSNYISAGYPTFRTDLRVRLYI